MNRTYTTDQLDDVAAELLPLLENSNLYALYGAMGSGKTTLTKAICRAMGVEEEVNSPTFAIVNEYGSPSGPIFHFDFYRIRNTQEALDLGLYDYFDSGRPCIMEWPECIEGLIPDDAVEIHIEIIDEETRRISL